MSSGKSTHLHERLWRVGDTVHNPVSVPAAQEWTALGVRTAAWYSCVYLPTILPLAVVMVNMDCQLDKI